MIELHDGRRFPKKDWYATIGRLIQMQKHHVGPFYELVTWCHESGRGILSDDTARDVQNVFVLDDDRTLGEIIKKIVAAVTTINGHVIEITPPALKPMAPLGNVK